MNNNKTKEQQWKEEVKNLEEESEWFLQTTTWLLPCNHNNNHFRLVFYRYFPIPSYIVYYSMINEMMKI